MSIVPPNIALATQPRALIRVNGTHEAVPMRFTVTTNGHGVLDTAEVTLPIKGNPDWAQIVTPGSPIPVEIYAGFPSDPSPNGYTYSDLSLRFSGTVDPLQPKFDLNEQTVTFACMSYGAILSINKTTTNLGGVGYANLAGIKTTQYIAGIAKQYGLKTDLRVKSPSTLQDVYATQQIVGVQNMRIWDILIACAQTDGAYLWFSSDKTLHYVDPALFNRVITERVYGGAHGVKGFDGSHGVQFNKEIRVEVRSYHSKSMVSSRSRVRQTYDANGNVTAVTVNSTTRAFKKDNFGNPGGTTTSTQTTINADGTRTVSSSVGSTLSTGGEQTSGYASVPTDSTAEKYIYKYYGLTQAQCDARAVQLWKWLSSHEYRGTFSIAMNPGVLPFAIIESKWRISNLPWYSFDQDYVPMRMTETFDQTESGDSGGWELQVLGINHRLPQGMI